MLPVLLLSLALWAYPDFFPPRTPLKVAGLVSGLEISEDIKFKMLQDDWSPNGDGTTYVKATLSNKQLMRLLQQEKKDIIHCLYCPFLI